MSAEQETLEKSLSDLSVSASASSSSSASSSASSSPAPPVFGCRFHGFISHAGPSKEFAKNLRKKIEENHRLNFFHDEQSLGERASNPQGTMVEAVLKSEVGIVVICQAFLDGLFEGPKLRPWCLFELRLLVAKHISATDRDQDQGCLIGVTLDSVDVAKFYSEPECKIKLAVVKQADLGLSDQVWAKVLAQEPKFNDELTLEDIAGKVSFPPYSSEHGASASRTHQSDPDGFIAKLAQTSWNTWHQVTRERLSDEYIMDLHLFSLHDATPLPIREEMMAILQVLKAQPIGPSDWEILFKTLYMYLHNKLIAKHVGFHRKSSFCALEVLIQLFGQQMMSSLPGDSPLQVEPFSQVLLESIRRARLAGVEPPRNFTSLDKRCSGCRRFSVQHSICSAPDCRQIECLMLGNDHYPATASETSPTSLNYTGYMCQMCQEFHCGSCDPDYEEAGCQLDCEYDLICRRSAYQCTWSDCDIQICVSCTATFEEFQDEYFFCSGCKEEIVFGDGQDWVLCWDHQEELAQCQLEDHYFCPRHEKEQQCQHESCDATDIECPSEQDDCPRHGKPCCSLCGLCQDCNSDDSDDSDDPDDSDDSADTDDD